MSEEIHIAGIVVHALPERAQQVAASIAGLSGAEVHAASADGKLVVTLEGSSAREIAGRIEAIQRLDARRVGFPGLSAQRNTGSDDGRGLP